MKHLKLFFALFAMLALGVGNAWGAETLYKTALFGANYNSKKVGSYTDTWTATNNGFTVTVVNANNNNNGWAYIKMGRKSDLSVGSITTQSAIDKPISKITMTIDAVTAKNIKSIKLKTSTNGSSFVEAGTFTISKGDQSVTINNPTANLYYQIEVDCNTGSNGSIQISKVQYYATEDAGSGGDEPVATLSATPTTIDFGTVYQGSTVADQTVTVNFENLTGNVTYSGLSTPFTATGTVSNDGDKITIKANTATIKEYSQTLTITSAADSKTAEVTVKMNVVEKPAPTGTFTLHTGDLIEGDYVIVSTNSLKAEVNSERLASLPVTISNDEIVDPDATTIWHIAKSGEYWTLYNANKAKYAASTGAKNKAALLDAGTDDKALWSVTGTSKYEFVNKKNTANSVNANLRYNSGNAENSRWACYSTSTGAALSLYRKAGAKYDVTVNSTTNGTVTADPTSAEAGTIITLTVTPAGGYVLDALTVTDASSNPVTVTDNKFTMPASDVTVTATFKANEKPAATLTLSKNGVAETFPGSWKQDDVVTLPSITSDCVKEFVGWSANPTCNVAPEYAAGDSYTLTATAQTLYAVYATAGAGETLTITPSAVDNDAENDIHTFTIDAAGYSLTAKKNSGSSAPTINASAKDVRIYAKGTVTLTAPKALNTIVFNISTQGKKRLAPITASVGAIATQASGDATVTWTGDATEVTFTVGDNANYGSESDKAGQLCFGTITVTTAGSYSNYSTTCAAAPIATVDPTSVTATVAGGNGKVEVTYENVNTTNVSVALYNDEACTETFTAGWLTASLDGDKKNITYTVAATTLYTERKAYIKLTAPETTGATDPAVVVIPVTQAGKDKEFASLEELLANITPTTTATKVTVTLTKEPIADIYVSGTYRNGIYLNVPYQGSTKKIEIYSRNVPAEWVVGGSVSGTLTNCDWKDYNGTWELCPADWSELTYQEPKAVSTVVVSGAPTKTTYVDGEAFDPAGLTVTVNYNDATTEVNPTGVTFTVTPTTLVKGQTSVSVTATFNSVTSEAYTVNNLTVTDIQSMTILDFITSGGTRCYLEGIVSNITNTTYGNFDLTDATGTIYVYGCLNDAGESQKFADLGVKNGDKIKVIADQYKVYGGKDQATDVQYVSHISAASITVENITMEVDEVATITATVDPADAVVTYTIKENEANAISLSGNTITALAEGTATITATVAEGATYLGNSVDFTVTVSPKAEKVVILAQLEGQWYAMTGAYVTDKTNVLAAIPVEYFNGTLYNVEEADKASIEWQRSMNGNKATFKNGDKYLTGGTSTDLTLKADAFEWDYNGVNYLCNDGKRTFLYCENMKNNVFGFKNFAISNAGSVKNNSDGTTESYSSFPTVTAPVYATGNPVYTRTVTNKYGTICLPYASASTSGAYFYEVVGKGTENGKPAVYLASVDALEAGVPYIFEKTANTITVTCQGEAIAEAGSANGLIGTFEEITVPNDAYILYRGAFCTNNDETKPNKINAYRAYLDLSAVNGGAPQQMPGRRYIGMDVQGENGTTGLDDIMTTGTPVKVIENGQLIIIRDGVKYNVQGVRL